MMSRTRILLPALAVCLALLRAAAWAQVPAPPPSQGVMPPSSPLPQSEGVTPPSPPAPLSPLTPAPPSPPYPSSSPSYPSSPTAPAPSSPALSPSSPSTAPSTPTPSAQTGAPQPGSQAVMPPPSPLKAPPGVRSFFTPPEVIGRELTLEEAVKIGLENAPKIVAAAGDYAASR